MKVLMLMDFPIDLLSALDDDVWKRQFLPTPVINLLEGLARIPELQVRVLSFSRSGSASAILWDRVHVKVINVPRGSGLATFYLPRVPHLLRAVDRYRADVVHGQGIEAGYAWLATLQPAPHVLTFHGVYGVTAYLKPQGVWQRLGYLLQGVTLKRAKHIVAISHFLEEWFRKNTTAQVYNIPNAVHDRFFRVAPAKKAEYDLLYVGRITPAKGLLDAIEAVSLLEKKRKFALRMAVIGRPTSEGDAYFRQCLMLAEELNSSVVHFFGALSDPELLLVLAKSKLLLMPSYEESFSMTSAEASAAGVPVIAYRVGGVPTVVKSGETGFLVDPGDIPQLAEAIEALLIDDRLRIQFGEAAKERAHSWHQDRVARQTAELYARIAR